MGTDAFRDAHLAGSDLDREANDRCRADTDLRAAKERLGAWWLENYENRSVSHVQRVQDGVHVVTLHPNFRAAEDGVGDEGAGPTEAAAILAALEKVNA